MTVFPFSRSAPYSDTQRAMDLAAPRSVGRLLDIERDRMIEQGIREIVTAYHRRRLARADAREHVRRLLIEAKTFRRLLLVAHCTGAYHLAEYEEVFRASEHDCIEAFRRDLYPNLKPRR